MERTICSTQPLADPFLPLLFQHLLSPGDPSQAPKMDEVKGQFPRLWEGGELGKTLMTDRRYSVWREACLGRTLVLQGEAVGSCIPGKEGVDGCIWGKN